MAHMEDRIPCITRDALKCPGGRRASSRHVLVGLASSLSLAVLTGLPIGAFVASAYGSRSFGKPDRRSPYTRNFGDACMMSATATSQTSSVGSTDCPFPVFGGRRSLAEDARSLFKDIADILGTTGLRMGFRRTFQAVRAAGQTGATIIAEPPEKLDEAFVARALRILFENLGTTYVKLGQFIASSPTVFPAAYVREFQRCLDSTNTVSIEEVRRIIEKDLGRPVDMVFSYFEAEPLASASIAQVHAATLATGEDVVVKVQKPGIENTLTTDLSFVYIAARILEFINPELNSRGSLVDIASDLRSSMLGELDFRSEADNLVTFRKFLEDNDLSSVASAPLPYPKASSQRVLTMERLRGVPLIDLDGIRQYSDDPESTLVAALNVWVLSVRNCEFFHADVHAGNLLVQEDGRVGFLDFGIVGRIPPKMLVAIDQLSAALPAGDAKAMARALVSMGATVGDVDEDAFAKDIAKLLERLGAAEGGQVNDAQVQDIVLDIAQTAGNNGLKLPREFGLLIKQALYFDRYTKLLAPDLDMMSDDRVARFG